MSLHDAGTLQQRQAAGRDPHCDPERFRHAIGHFPTGVAVVTTAYGGARHGMTASAVTSVSLEPPLLLVCMHRDAPTHAAVSTARRFAVNVLEESQIELAERFATPLDDKFDGVAVEDGSDGIPLLRGALAHVECEVVEELPGGTHSIFLAEVRRAQARAGTPLVHFKGSFRRLEPADSPSEHDQGG